MSLNNRILALFIVAITVVSTIVFVTTRFTFKGELQGIIRQNLDDVVSTALHLLAAPRSRIWKACARPSIGT